MSISKEGLAHLKRHEGYRKHMYKCSEGFNTIGYGLNLDAGLDEEVASFITEFIANRIDGELTVRLEFYKILSQRRKDVLINMAYNLGIEGLMGFKNTIHLISVGKFDEASAAMLKSKWASQVGARARFLADQMRTG
jgi:lysozyme